MASAFALAVDYPSWWTNREVIGASVSVTNDYAAVNAGQVKWFATNAYDELNARLPGGAGSNLTALIQSFSATNNYQAVNAGQLKYMAAVFYDRLIEAGVSNAYPWTATTTDDVDCAAANIGQLKQLFTFELLVATNEAATISGNVSYSGGQTGMIRVVAVTTSNGWDLAYAETLLAPGAYSITNVPVPADYWVKAFRDSNGNGTKETAEAWGAYAGSPLYLTNDQSGVDLTLTDPDSDGDGLFDWVETDTGVYGGPEDTGSDPNDADSDDDGTDDGTEVANRTNPNNEDADKPVVVIESPRDNEQWVELP